MVDSGKKQKVETMRKQLLIISILLVGLLVDAQANKPVKVKVVQDAFVQGGETADESLGTSKPGRLRVMKSDDNTKYSRTSYLQFNLKKVEDFSGAELNICVRIFPSKADPSATFSLNVYACENNKWNESNLTFNNKPERGELLATQVFSANNDNKWVQITLPSEKVMALKKNSKKGKVTLVLANDDFNKTSMEIISKERTWSNGMPAKREAYLKLVK